jgi:hypothetical protein
MEAHAGHDEFLDTETRDYNDLMNAGKDFKKIELYAYAIKKYKEALVVKPFDKDANAEINACRSRLRSDNNIILLIAVIAIVAVGILLVI